MHGTAVTICQIYLITARLLHGAVLVHFIDLQSVSNRYRLFQSTIANDGTQRLCVQAVNLSARLLCQTFVQASIAIDVW